MTLETAKRLYNHYKNGKGTPGEEGYVAPNKENLADLLAKRPELAPHVVDKEEKPKEDAKKPKGRAN